MSLLTDPASVYFRHGKRHLWRDIIKLRQEQCRAAAEATPLQPPRFGLHENFRPITERTAALRYLEPSLFF